MNRQKERTRMEKQIREKTVEVEKQERMRCFFGKEREKYRKIMEKKVNMKYRDKQK